MSKHPKIAENSVREGVAALCVSVFDEDRAVLPAAEIIHSVAAGHVKLDRNVVAEGVDCREKREKTVTVLTVFYPEHIELEKSDAPFVISPAQHFNIAVEKRIAVVNLFHMSYLQEYVKRFIQE